MVRKTLAVRILAVIALVSTALAAIGWVVFLGGFGYLTTNRLDLIPNPVILCKIISGDANLQDRSDITGPCWDPYWLVSVLSPILFILLIVKAILMIIKDELFRKFFVIHILAVIAFIITVITLCSMGFLMVQMRDIILGIVSIPIQFRPTDTGFINALFAGALLETIFLGVAWICHILAFLFGGMPESQLSGADTSHPGHT